MTKINLVLNFLDRNYVDRNFNENDEHASMLRPILELNSK